MNSPSRSLDELGRQQRAILDFLWNHSEGTVREVWIHLSPSKSLAYTSILSAMQKLERLGWLRHVRQGRTYVYSPSTTRHAAEGDAISSFVDRVFGGDSMTLRRHVLAKSEVQCRSLRDRVDARRAAA